MRHGPCRTTRRASSGIIHGDLHSGNGIVDRLNQDRVIAMLDFEEAGENLYLLDLANTLLAAGSLPGGHVLEPALVQAVIRGYEQLRQLTAEERAWLPRAVRYAAEACTTWFRANGYEPYARHHEDRLASFTAALRLE